MINIRFQGQVKKPDNTVVAIDPKEALFRRGPVIPVVIHPDAAFVIALQAAGKEIPQPVSGLALVDTGATTTCVDGDTALKMGLASNGTAKMCSASHDNADCLTYPVRLTFTGWNVNLDAAKAMGVSISKQGIIALVGRDLLKKCILVYNGADGSFSIAM